MLIEGIDFQNVPSHLGWHNRITGNGLSDEVKSFIFYSY